jgi:hypothetical protein
MSDTAIVQIFQGVDDIPDDQTRFVLGEAYTLLDVIQQWTAAHLLED